MDGVTSFDSGVQVETFESGAELGPLGASENTSRDNAGAVVGTEVTRSDDDGDSGTDGSCGGDADGTNVWGGGDPYDTITAPDQSATPPA